MNDLKKTARFMILLQKLIKQLEKVEKKLDKCRTSTLDDGWQTMRYAKKARKWDYYAQEKMRLKCAIEGEKKKKKKNGI